VKEPNVIEEKDLVKVVEEASKNGTNSAMEQQGYINIAYFAGKQWISWDKANNRLFEPPKEAHKVRFVGNRIQPIVRTELAKITKTKPIVNVIPASNDDDDIKSAHLGQKIADWLFYELDLQEANKELAMWGLCTDIAFMKPYWNPSKGDSVVSPQGEQMNLGDIDYDVVSMFDVKIDPTAKKWKEVKWIVHEKPREVDYIKEVYGKDVAAESGIAVSNIFSAKLKDLNNIGTETKTDEVKSSAIVREYWEKPSSKYPKGRRITVANHVLLLYEEDIGFGEADKTERELPFFPFVHIVIPGRVNGMSVIENLIPVQREYNKTRSQIIENKNIISNPVWLVEEGSIDVEITDEPGQVVQYKKGFAAPKIEQPPVISSDVYRNLEECKEEFDFISGQHEVSHGETPTGVTSGTAISFLQEQDDTKLGPTVQNLEKCIEKYIAYMLKIIKIKYNIPRTINIVGKNNSVEVIQFQGSQLTSTDVRVQAGSSLPQSKAAKQDWVINLLHEKLLDPVRDRDLILKMLELGITEDLYSDATIDVNQAQNEVDKWKKGDGSPIVRDFYNHMVHIKEHDKFRKSDEYEELPPELQMMIDEHVKQHENYLMMTAAPPMGEQPMEEPMMNSQTQPPIM
jgi:hypothetical protein